MTGSRRAEELRGPPYTRLWASARRAMERTGGLRTGTVTLAAASPDERRALHALLGRPSTRVSLEDLDAALRAGAGCGLDEWLEVVGGPLRDRPSERASRAVSRAATEATALDHPLAGEPWFEPWLAGLRTDGTFAKVARQGTHEPLVDALQLLSVVLWGELDRVPLAAVAASVTGDTKRLTSTTVRTMVERALALVADVERPHDSRARRLLWRRFGVIIDDVSSDVLVLNLQPRGDGHVDRWLRSAAEVGEPFRVTLRQLESASRRVDAPVVWVCENPAVVMDVAGRLGPASGPLLCTDGVPSDAFWALAAALDKATELRVHADFDAAGCTIAGAVIAQLGARPWRFDAPSYRDALSRFGATMNLPMSKGQVPSTPWDPELAIAVADDGRAIYEELLIDTLVADLAR